MEEYYMAMQKARIQANIEEDREVTMTRFINGLNREIRKFVELQHYIDMEELLHKATLVEDQVKTEQSYSRSKWKDNKSSWKPYKAKGDPASSSKSNESSAHKLSISKGDYDPKSSKLVRSGATNVKD